MSDAVVPFQVEISEAEVADLRERLARNRTTDPLFDTARFARHIEAAYTTMWQRYRNGEPPQSFAVDRMA